MENVKKLPNSQSHVQVNPYINGESSYPTARMVTSYRAVRTARPWRRGYLKRKTVEAHSHLQCLFGTA